MTSEATVNTQPRARTERYRAAERTLWATYGLEPSERFVELKAPAVRLRVQEVGRGEPILFVHGGLWPGVALAPLVRELPGFRSIVIDRPGCGLSSATDWRRADHASIVTRVMGGVLDALGLDQTDVIGHSIGGVWALRAAAANPDRIRRVVILGASPVLDEMAVPGFLRVLASPIGAIIIRLPQNQGRARSILRQDGHSASLDAGRIPDAFFDWHVALVRNTDTLRNERAFIRDAVIGPLAWRPGLTFVPAELAVIRQSLLYVIGTNDPEGSVDHARHIVAALPNADLRTVTDGGHMPWLDDAGLVGSATRRFLETPNPAASMEVER